MISIEVIEKLWAAATKAPWELGPMKLYIFAKRGMVADHARCDDPDAPANTILRLRGIGSGQDLGANGAAIAAAPTHIAWLISRIREADGIFAELELVAAAAAARPNPLQQVFDVACRYVDNGRDDADNVDGVDIADAVHAVRGNPDWRPRTEGVTPTVDELRQQLKDAKRLINESAGDADLHAAEFMVVANMAEAANDKTLHTLAIQAAQACHGIALGLRGEKWPEPAAEDGEGT